MEHADLLIVVALSAWKTNIERAEKLFSGLSDDQLSKEVAPGKNRLIYLMGHLTAVHDGIPQLLGQGTRSYPEYDATFLKNPDKSQTNTPPVAEVRKAWKDVNAKIAEAFA